VASRTVRGFSDLGAVSVATLLATGIVNTWVRVGSVELLTGSAYGRLLLFKIALFASMLGFAAVNRLWLTQRLVPAESQQATRAARAICQNAVAELGLGIVIFVVVGFLGHMDPGMPGHSQGHMH